MIQLVDINRRGPTYECVSPIQLSSLGHRWWILTSKSTTSSAVRDTSYKGWESLAKYCIVQNSQKLNRRSKSGWTRQVPKGSLTRRTFFPYFLKSIPTYDLRPWRVLTGPTLCNDKLEAIEGAILILVRAENIELPHLTSYLAKRRGTDANIALRIFCVLVSLLRSIYQLDVRTW